MSGVELSEGESGMEVSAKYLSDAKFELRARDHLLICDQPTDNGGTDQGPSPPEFLLAALASCAAYYAVQYLRTRGLPVENLTARVQAEKKATPARLDAFRITVFVDDMEPRHHVGLKRSVETCLIHNTLLSSPAIQVSVEAGDRAVDPAPLHVRVAPIADNPRS